MHVLSSVEGPDPGGQHGEPIDVDIARVCHLIVPVYPKIRLQYQLMHSSALYLLAILHLADMLNIENCELDFRFMRGTEHKSALLT